MCGSPILLKYTVLIQIWSLLLDCWNYLINKHSSIRRPCHSYWLCFNRSSWSVDAIPLCCLPLNKWPTFQSYHQRYTHHCYCRIAVVQSLPRILPSSHHSFFVTRKEEQVHLVQGIFSFTALLNKTTSHQHEHADKSHCTGGPLRSNAR
jgi:hypothetical protein